MQRKQKKLIRNQLYIKAEDDLTMRIRLLAGVGLVLAILLNNGVSSSAQAQMDEAVAVVPGREAGQAMVEAKMVTGRGSVQTLMEVAAEIETETETAVEMVQRGISAETVRVVVNGQELIFPDVQPYLDANGRTQVPTRFVGEALGANVSWNERSQKVTFTLETEDNIKFVEFQIDQVEYYIRIGRAGTREKYEMDTKAVLENSRTFIPVRYAAEALDAIVRWDEAMQTVYIETPDASVVSDPTSTSEEPRWVAVSDDMFDERGLYKAQYANPLYQSWFESVRIIYEGEKLFLSYTVPHGIPAGAEFTIDVLITPMDEYQGTAWMIYHSSEMTAGHRKEGREYLLPNTPGIEVKKEFRYISVEYISSFRIDAYLTKPVGAVLGKAEAYAQTFGNIYVFPSKKRGISSFRIGAVDKELTSELIENLSEVTIDPIIVIQNK